MEHVIAGFGALIFLFGLGGLVRQSLPFSLVRLSDGPMTGRSARTAGIVLMVLGLGLVATAFVLWGFYSEIPWARS